MPPVRRFSIAVALRGRGQRYQCRHGPSAGERYTSSRPLVARARIRTRKGRSRKERSEKLEKLYHRYSLVSTTAFEPLGALGASDYRDHGTRTRRVSGRVIQLLSYVSRPPRVLKTCGSYRRTPSACMLEVVHGPKGVQEAHGHHHNHSRDSLHNAGFHGAVRRPPMELK